MPEQNKEWEEKAEEFIKKLDNNIYISQKDFDMICNEFRSQRHSLLREILDKLNEYKCGKHKRLRGIIEEYLKGE